ncbi:MAG TPA: polysaccharide deacetylase family protein [Bacteroidales bacterium]|nr:polysaccharide deacetylase family protein [Bacteroidales bacterium]
MKAINYILFFVSICISVACNQKTKSIPDKLIVLTFDDACSSHYSFVAPLLKQYGFGATFFVCEFPPNFADSSLYMNWRQMKELDNMGFEIANHTHSHPSLPKLTEDEIAKQLSYIENKFDSLKISRSSGFSYPGSVYNDTVLKVLNGKGYRLARIGGNKTYDPAKDSPMLIPSWIVTEESISQIIEALKEAKDGKIVVLTVHGVPDVEHPWVNTSPESFRKLAKYLYDNHYKVVAFNALDKYSK